MLIAILTTEQYIHIFFLIYDIKDTKALSEN